jgi:hypothetical protein
LLGGARDGVRAEPGFKADRTPSVVADNMLFIEADLAPRAVETLTAETVTGETRGGEAPASDAPIVSAKFHPKTCSAAAVQIPNRGVRVVTAAHCSGDGLSLFDGRHWLEPRSTWRASDGSDLALLDFAVPAWSGLPTRSSTSVAIGERLCAWRVTRHDDRLHRESICARLVDRKSRPDGQPLLVTSHPYPCGTSGSPLVDVEGRAVGVVVASNGLVGFAEPIEAVLAIAENAGPVATGAGESFVRR